MVYKGIIGVVVAVSLIATGTIVLAQSGSQLAQGQQGV
jgi:hypothetical protein